MQRTPVPKSSVYRGCSQRHRRVHPLSHHHINAVFLLFSFGPNWVNVTYESIRDVTMFSVLIFEKNLLNKITLEKEEECKRTVLLNKNE